MAGAFGLGAVLLLPVLALHHDGLTQPGGIVLALFLGIVPTALAYVLFARGLKRLSAAETATLTLAEPLTATVLGVIVLGESFAPLGVGADPRRPARARGARDPPSRLRFRRDDGRHGHRRAPRRDPQRRAPRRRPPRRSGADRPLRRRPPLAAGGAAGPAGRGPRQVETNRGARVNHLDAQDILQLYELRTALEVEAARLALERHGGQLPVRDALRDAHPRLRGAAPGETSTSPTPGCTARSSRRRSRPGSRPRTARSTASCSCS